MTRAHARLLLRFTVPAAVAAVAVLAAACSPEPKDGTPITGTLFSAVGPSAPLTLDVGNVFGGGFALDAELDGVAVSGTANWACYAPLPPDFPNFDIEAFDEAQTFGFFISVSPAVWGSSGALTIDGDDVRVLVSGRDRFGVVTSGSVSFTQAGQAPDTAGNNCAFSLTGPLTLEGEKD